MRRRETERVKRAIEYVRRRLRVDMEFVVSAGRGRRAAGLLDIERSYRGTEDRKVWLVTLRRRARLEGDARSPPPARLSRGAPRADVAALRRGRGRHPARPRLRLRSELMERSIDARENVVYELERKIGPLCFPSLPWVDP